MHQTLVRLIHTQIQPKYGSRKPWNHHHHMYHWKFLSSQMQMHEGWGLLTEPQALLGTELTELGELGTERCQANFPAQPNWLSRGQFCQLGILGNQAWPINITWYLKVLSKFAKLVNSVLSVKLYNIILFYHHLNRIIIIVLAHYKGDWVSLRYFN